MAKLNTPGRWAAARSPITTAPTATITTAEGAPGWERDPKSELFLLAVSHMVGEDKFYESAQNADDRFVALVRANAVNDPAWTAGFLRWLRAEGNMRTASIVGGAEYAHATKGMPLEGRPTGRSVVSSVQLRADEPGEMMAYATAKFGRVVPKPIKRGVADAAIRLYDERAWLKYDSAARGWRPADVVDMVRPEPKAQWQSDLFRHMIDDRHGHVAEIPATLTMLQARAELLAMPVEERRVVIANADFPEGRAAQMLRDAGMTWESLAGWLQGPMDKDAWEAIIPSMGYMALLRNLRNFDDAEVSDEVAARVMARLVDPEQVAKSRQFPMRFLSAFKAAPSLRWAHALEQALNLSLGNVPELKGNMLILVDRSGSMTYGTLSGRSTLTYADGAAVFGAALAVRSENADLVEFGTTHRPVAFRKSESVLKIVGRFGDMGGTNTAEAVRANLRPKHTRVVILTDEQAWGGHYGGDPVGVVPANIPVYTWNLAGYRAAHGPSGTGNRHAFGGLTDQAFRMIPLIEAGANQAWPWIVREPAPEATRVPAPGSALSASSLPEDYMSNADGPWHVSDGEWTGGTT